MMKLRTLSLTLFLALWCLPFSTIAGTLQIVNDSAVPDKDVYVLLSGNALNPSASTIKINAVGLDTSPTGVVCGQQLSTLSKSTLTVLSDRTGNPLQVYEVPIDAVSSGRLWVSYYSEVTPNCVADNGVVQFKGAAAPLNTESYRYDKMEFTYDGTTWNANLTALDFLAIPMRLETVKDGLISDSRSFYASMYTMGIGAYSLFGASSMGWNDKAFLRIYGPGVITTDVNTTSGSPEPYPSFAPYLSSMVNTTNMETSGTQSFAALSQGSGAPQWTDDNGTTHYLEIPAYTAKYDYDIQVQASDNGYNLLLTCNSFTVTDGVLPSYLPAGGAVDMTIPLTGKKLDRNLYATPLDSSTFQLGSSITYPTDPNTPCDNKDSKDSYYAAAVGNTVYGWIVANVTSGLVLGFFNSDAKSNSTADWYGPIPPMQPFGGARTWLDGFYDPYAAIIFNASDAYGFPFSDRITVGVNPLLQSTDPTLRVTLLADDMPDAPIVNTTPGDSSGNINITWQDVPCYSNGCTVGYTVEVWPQPPSPITQPKAGETSLSLTGLSPGVIYTVKVSAQVTSGKSTSQSPVLPVQGMASGSYAMQGSYQLQVASNWQVPQGWTLNIAGKTLGSGGQVIVTGVAGKNHFPVVLKNADDVVVYQNNYEVDLADPDPSGGSYQLLAVPVLGENNSGNSIPLTYASATCSSPNDALPCTINSQSLVIGTPGNPIIGKQREPVVALNCLFNTIEKTYGNYFPSGPATIWQDKWNPSPTHPGVGRQYSNGNAVLASNSNDLWGIFDDKSYNVGTILSWLNECNCVFPVQLKGVPAAKGTNPE